MEDVQARAGVIHDAIGAYHDDLTRIRQDIHAHPELGFEEQRTSDIVAAELEKYGIEVYRGIGKTGVVGALRVGNSPRSVGLRADMDALPIHESNTFGHASTHAGVMHACGHDGHAAMLLGAAAVFATIFHRIKRQARAKRPAKAPPPPPPPSPAKTPAGRLQI